MPIRPATTKTIAINAWCYRDYVIESFNSDLPYDQFMQEQVAGDLLPPPSSGSVNRRSIVATGFLALGPKALAQQDKKKMLYDVYDEQIDVLSKTFLGLTVACARCHDHKFDPITTRDYYSLASIFANTRSFQNPNLHVAQLLDVPLVPAAEYEKYRSHQRSIAYHKLDIEEQIDGERHRRAEDFLANMADYMVAARRIYEDRVAIAIAPQGRLRQDLLLKWAHYLKPRDIHRPHLQLWHDTRREDRGGDSPHLSGSI